VISEIKGLGIPGRIRTYAPSLESLAGERWGTDTRKAERNAFSYELKGAA
jgi:hypothetical protein